MKKIICLLISLLIFANSAFAIEPQGKIKSHINYSKTVDSLINTGDVLGNNG